MQGVQATVMVTTVFALVLVALISDRRSHEVLLERSNEKLRHQEEAFRRLLETLPAAIHTTDTAGRITYCNKEAIDLWGVTPEIGKDKWTDLGGSIPDGRLIPTRTSAPPLCLRERRAVPEREALLERPDGKRIPILPYPAPLTDEQGEVVGVVNMKIDITERKRAKRPWPTAMRSSPWPARRPGVGSYTYDYDSEVMMTSPGLRSASMVCLRARSRCTRTKCRARVHPDDLRSDCTRRSFRRAVERAATGVRFRIPNCPGGDGEARWIETRAFISYDSNGHPSRVTGVNIDTTDRKQSEDHKALLDRRARSSREEHSRVRRSHRPAHPRHVHVDERLPRSARRPSSVPGQHSHSLEPQPLAGRRHRRARAHRACTLHEERQHAHSWP